MNSAANFLKELAELIGKYRDAIGDVQFSVSCEMGEPEADEQNPEEVESNREYSIRETAKRWTVTKEVGGVSVELQMSKEDYKTREELVEFLKGQSFFDSLD